MAPGKKPAMIALVGNEGQELVREQVCWLSAADAALEEVEVVVVVVGGGWTGVNVSTGVVGVDSVDVVVDESDSVVV